MLIRPVSASAARTRRFASAGEIRKVAAIAPRQRGVAQHARQVPPLRVPHRLMVGQGEPVPEPLQALQVRHEPGVVVAFEPAVLDQLQQMLIPHGEGVERRIDRVPTPEIHTHMLLEYTFEINQRA